MKILSLTLLAVLLLSAPSFQEEESEYTYSQSRAKNFPACKGEFKPDANICSKFGFISSEEAVKKGCINPTNGTTYYDLSALPKVDNLDPQKVLITSMITNVFEDGDPFFAYASCSDIADLRGYTCGYPGFTTGTGDAEELLVEYTKQYPDNALSKYINRIHQTSQLPHCDRKNRGDTTGLEGFCNDWKNEACGSNGRFGKLQRDWVYKQYVITGARYAAANGVVSPLGQAIFYDTIIQHGYQYVEPDINIVRILVLTGPRGKDESEPAYLTRFLTTRRQLQCCYPDNVWPASGTRSEDFQTLVNDFERYKSLDPPILLRNFQRTITGNEDVSRDVKRCAATGPGQGDGSGNGSGNGNENGKENGQNEDGTTAHSGSLRAKNKPLLNSFLRGSVFESAPIMEISIACFLALISIYMYKM